MNTVGIILSYMNMDILYIHRLDNDRFYILCYVYNDMCNCVVLTR